MKKKIVILLILLCNTAYIYSQVDTSCNNDFKHSFGFQYNHAANSLSEFFGGGLNKRRVFAFRYGYHLNPNIIVGPEISGFTCTNNLSRIISIHAGVYGSYQINYLKILKPFAEINAFYVNRIYYKFQTNNVENSRSLINGYVAPGISFFLFKNRVSIDLMYKISPREILELKHCMISYRINYNFNFKK